MKKSSSTTTRPAQATTSGSRHFQPFYFIFTGDPHIGVTKGANRRFRQQTEQINSLKPDFVLIPGDMVHGLKEKNMAILDPALEEFEAPVRFIPGNHDIRNHDTLNTYRRRYGKDYYVFTHNNCDFICLNSMTLSSDTQFFKTKDDRFGAEVQAQWDWLEKTLASSKAARRDHIFIHMHIPPFTKKEDERKKYTNMPPESRKRLLALARKYDVQAILAGHTHMTRETRADGIVIYTVGGTYRPTDLRGYGYRIFKVEKDRITQKYVRLSKPVKKLDF